MAPQKVLLGWEFFDSTAFGQVMLDASVNEQHIVTAQVTDQQIETGLNPTDNIRPLPSKLTIEGLVTNTPLGIPETQSGGVTGSTRDVSVTVGGQQISYRAFQFDGEIDRVREVFGDLVDAIQGAALFSITTTLKRYEKHALINFSVQRNAEKGSALHFTADFQEIRIVSTSTVAALPAKAQKQHRGAKTGTPLDEKKDEKKIATLRKLVIAGGKLLQ